MGLKECLWCHQSSCGLQFDEWDEHPNSADPCREGGLYIKCFMCQARSPIYWYKLEEREAQSRKATQDWNARADKTR